MYVADPIGVLKRRNAKLLTKWWRFISLGQIFIYQFTTGSLSISMGTNHIKYVGQDARLHTRKIRNAILIINTHTPQQEGRPFVDQLGVGVEARFP